MNKNYTFWVTDFTQFKLQMLSWANQFNIFCLLDNQQYNFTEPAFECLLAVGCKKNISLQSGNAFAQLKKFCAQNKGWLFGHLGYDLKNETEKLQSTKEDKIGFADVHFFVPQIVIQLFATKAIFFCDEPEQAQYYFNEIQSTQTTTIPNGIIKIKKEISKNDYLKIIKKLQQHILRGDCYEINFCQNFYAEDALINPVQTYKKLMQLSPSPFAALYKVNDKFCICASPERYLKKLGHTLISQPIKGTAKRNLQNKKIDLQNKNNLLTSQKEKSENVMAVDLVRNDLSKICKPGSVKVDELFGIYSFPQVHQMISTISGSINENVDWIEIIKATFPMASMTGVPKKSVMQLIEKYEQTKRGLFSGAIGYINPEGNFDFNVVIRSIFYNASAKYLCFKTGGGITFYSNPKAEYEECMLKAAAMIKVLRGAMK